MGWGNGVIFSKYLYARLPLPSSPKKTQGSLTNEQSFGVEEKQSEGGDGLQHVHLMDA